MRPRTGSRAAAVMVALALTAGLAACGREDEAAGNGEDASVQASPGITEDEIRIGGTFPFSGPVSIASGIPKAAQAYFDAVNAEGGIDGRKIVFEAVDDASDPTQTVQATKRLVERDEVFAIFGTVSTPNNLAVMPYLNQREVPQVYVSTGASVFGADPAENPWTIGFPPDYVSEGAVFGRYLVERKPDAKVAVLYQNDGLGEDYLRGFEPEIEGSGVEIVAREGYEVTDPSVASQVSALKSSGADTLLILTTPKFGAQALAATHKLGWRPLKLLASISASTDLVLTPVGPAATKGVVSAAWTKDPRDARFADDPDVVAYEQALADYADGVKPGDFYAIGGYTAASALVTALREMEEPTRASFMEAVRNMDAELPLLLPGVTARTTPQDGFPIQAMQMQQFDGERWELQGDVIDTSQE